MIKKNKALKNLITSILATAIVVTSIPQTSVNVYAENDDMQAVIEEYTDIEEYTGTEESVVSEEYATSETSEVIELEESIIAGEEEVELAEIGDYEYYNMRFNELNFLPEYLKAVNIEIYSEMPAADKLRPDDESKILYSGSYSDSDPLELANVEALRCADTQQLYFRISPEYQDSTFSWHDGIITFSLNATSYNDDGRVLKEELYKARQNRIERGIPYVYYQLSYSDYCQYRSGAEDYGTEFEGVEFFTVASTNLYDDLKLERAACIDNKVYWKIDANGMDTYSSEPDYKWQCYYSTEGADPSKYEFKPAASNVFYGDVDFTDASGGNNYDDNQETKDKQLYRSYITPPIDFSTGNPQDIWFYFEIKSKGEVVAVSNVITNQGAVNGMADGKYASDYSGGITLIKYKEDTDEYEVLKKDEPCTVHATEDVRFGIALVSADGQTVTPMDQLPEIYEDDSNIINWSQHSIFYSVDRWSGEIRKEYHQDPDLDYELNHLEKIDAESVNGCDQWYSFIEAPSYSEFESDYDGLVYITINVQNYDKYGCYYNTFPIKVLPAEEGVEYFHYVKDSNSAIVGMSNFNAKVREHLLKHEESFTLYADSDTVGENFSLDVAFDFYEERGEMKSYEGECLEGTIQDCTFSISQTEDAAVVAYDFKVNYITTLEQEQQVDKWIADILSNELKDVKGESVTNKAKAVYDYVTRNVSNKVGTNTDAERKKAINHTIYTALNPDTKYGTSEAYALLYSRLCRELGVESRVVYGTDANNHTYNIVHLKDADEGNYWYYVDCSAGLWKKAYTEFSSIAIQDRFLNDQFVLNYFRYAYGYKSEAVARVTDLDGKECYVGSLLLCKYYIIDSPSNKYGYNITLLEDATISSGELDYAKYTHESDDCNSTAHYHSHVTEDISSYVKLDLNGHKLTVSGDSKEVIRVSEVKNGSIILSDAKKLYLSGGAVLASDCMTNGPEKYALYKNVAIKGQGKTDELVLSGAVKLEKDCQVTSVPKVQITLGNCVDCNLKGLDRIKLGGGADIGDIWLNGEIETDYLQLGGFGSDYYNHRKAGNNCFNIVRVRKLDVKKGSILEQGTYLQINDYCSLAGTTCIRSDAFSDGDPSASLSPANERNNKYPATIQLVRSKGILAELNISGTLNEYEIGTKEDYSEEAEGLPALEIYPVTVNGREWPVKDLFRKGDIAATVDLTGITAKHNTEGGLTSNSEKIDSSNYSNYIRFADVRKDASGNADGKLIYNSDGSIIVAQEMVLSDEVKLEKGETIVTSELSGIEAGKYKWSSDNSAVATVSLVDGKAYITGKSVGKTIIIAEKDNVTVKINVTVVEYLKYIQLVSEDKYVASSEDTANMRLTFSPSSTVSVVPEVISINCLGESVTEEAVSGIKDTDGNYVYSFVNSPISKILYEPATRKLMLYRKQELDKKTEVNIRVGITNEVGEAIVSNAAIITCCPDEKAGSVDEIATGSAAYLDLEKYSDEITFHGIVGLNDHLSDVILSRSDIFNIKEFESRYGWKLVYPNTDMKMYSCMEKAYFPVTHTNAYTGEVIYGEIPVYFAALKGYRISRTIDGPECSVVIPFDKNKTNEGEIFTVVPQFAGNTILTTSDVEVEINSDDENLTIKYTEGRNFRFVSKKAGKYTASVVFSIGDHYIMDPDGKSKLTFSIPINVIDVTDSGYASVNAKIKTDDGTIVEKGADGYITLNKDTKYYLYDETTYTYGTNLKHKLSLAQSDKTALSIGKAETTDGGIVRYPLIVKGSGRGCITVTANDAVKSSIKIPIKLINKDKSTVTLSKTAYNFNGAFTKEQKVDVEVFNGFEGTIKSVELIPNEKGGFDGLNSVVSSNTISIKANNSTKPIKAGKGIARITFDELKEPVDIKISVSVKVQAPKIKVALVQPGSTFEKDRPATFKLTQTMDAEIDSVTVDGISNVPSSEVYYSYASDKQELSLHNLTADTAKKKYTVMVNFKDYVGTKCNISPKVTGDVLKLSVGSGTIYNQKSISLMEMRTQLVDNKKNVYSLNNVSVAIDSDNSEIKGRYAISVKGNNIIITANSLPSKAEKLKLVIRSEKWNSEKIAYFTVKPGKTTSLKLALGSGSVDFYNYKDKDSSARVGISLKGYNGDATELLSNMQFVSADKKSPQKDALGKYFTMRYDRYSSEIVLEKLSDRIADGTYKVSILIEGDGLSKPLSATLSIKVKGVETFGESGGIITKLSTKNSIDLLNRENTFAVLTPTIKGMAGSAQYVPVGLYGEDANLFEIVPGGFDVKKGTVQIRLKNNSSVLTGHPYKIAVRYRITDGVTSFYQKSPEATIKFSQKNPKAVVTMEKGVLSTSASGTDRIAISLKTTGKNSVPVKVLKAELNGNSDFTISDISNLEANGYLTVDYTPMGGTAAGKSYVLSLSIVPEGSAMNAKPIIVKLKVKIAK